MASPSSRRRVATSEWRSAAALSTPAQRRGSASTRQAPCGPAATAASRRGDGSSSPLVSWRWVRGAGWGMYWARSRSSPRLSRPRCSSRSPPNASTTRVLRVGRLSLSPSSRRAVASRGGGIAARAAARRATWRCQRAAIRDDCPLCRRVRRMTAVLVDHATVVADDARRVDLDLLAPSGGREQRPESQGDSARAPDQGHVASITTRSISASAARPGRREGGASRLSSPDRIGRPERRRPVVVARSQRVALQCARSGSGEPLDPVRVTPESAPWLF
jgi:hypothetical protein